MSGQALSLSFDGQAVSQYMNWPFSGFFTLGAVTYGVAPTGIHAIGGPDDAGEPVTVLIRFPATDGGRPGETGLESVEIGGALPEGGCLRVLYDGESKGEYPIPGRAGGHHTVYAGRSAHGRYLQLELTAEGAGFELRSLFAEARDLGRRRGR